jgi:hypothetical protein
MAVSPISAMGGVDRAGATLTGALDADLARCGPFRPAALVVPANVKGRGRGCRRRLASADICAGNRPGRSPPSDREATP